jgi:hypothetical protein
MPLLMSADALIAATTTKGTMPCSLASDYSIRIRSSQKKEKLRWELLPLSRWEGPKLGIGAIALRALSKDGAKEEGGFMLWSAALLVANGLAPLSQLSIPSTLALTAHHGPSMWKHLSKNATRAACLGN